MRIAVDAMGGDFGPAVVVPAAMQLAKREPELEIQLFGDQASIEHQLDSAGQAANSKIKIFPAKSLDPLYCDGKAVLVQGRDSSLFKSIDALRNASADACVSAGSTAAMMVCGLRLLKALPAIHRPAICAALPQKDGFTYLLDLGANAECNANNLLQFAQLAAVLAEVRHGLARPTVALLSNGSEPHKGNKLVRESAKLIQNSVAFEYMGYVEADQLFHSGVDIVVCDGFSGNIALKASEGAANVVMAELADSADSNNQHNRLISRFTPSIHNGAFFLGLNGVMIKSHGRANVDASLQAMLKAVELVKGNWLARHQQVFRTN